MPAFAQTMDKDGNIVWSLGGGTTGLPDKTDEAMKITKKAWNDDDIVFVIARYGDEQDDTGDSLNKIMGNVQDDGTVAWDPVESQSAPTLLTNDIYKEYPAATLTSHAFDRVIPGFGTWMVLFASWLFAISTMISWSYYGEQGVVFLFGDKSVLLYKVIYCLLIVVSTLGFISTDAELDNLTTLGTGVMLWANIPIMLIFGSQVMRAYSSYFKRLKAGEFHPHAAPSITDVVEGKDIE